MIRNPARTRQSDCLYFLSQTGFATLRHFEKSGIIAGASRHGKAKVLDELVELKAIDRLRVKSPYNIGSRVAYQLTRTGAELVAKMERLDVEDLRYSPPVSDYNREVIRAEFPHKEAYVSALIALARYLEGTEYSIAKMHHYYDRRRDSTTLEVEGKRFRPDGMVFLEPITPGMPEYRYILEIHRHSDRKKLIQQLKQHTKAHSSGSFQKRFGDIPHFVFSIYSGENTAIMRSVIDELRRDAEVWSVIEKFFIFAELESLETDFAKSCAYFGGSKKPLPAVTKKGD